MKSENITIDELNDQIKDFLIQTLGVNNFKSRIDEDAGIVWVDVGEKTYSLCYRFNECPF